MQTIMPLTALSHDTLYALCRLEQQLFSQDSWDGKALAELYQQDYNHFFGLQIDGVLIGYAIVQVMFDTAEILRIGIDFNQQGQGLGKQLLQAVLDFLAKTQVEKLLLEVRQDNVSAIHLYQSMGFKQIHIRKNYYQNQDGATTDALIMQLDLPT